MAPQQTNIHHTLEFCIADYKCTVLKTGFIEDYYLFFSKLGAETEKKKISEVIKNKLEQNMYFMQSLII